LQALDVDVHLGDRQPDDALHLIFDGLLDAVGDGDQADAVGPG